VDRIHPSLSRRLAELARPLAALRPPLVWWGRAVSAHNAALDLARMVAMYVQHALTPGALPFPGEGLPLVSPIQGMYLNDQIDWEARALAEQSCRREEEKNRTARSSKAGKGSLDARALAVFIEHPDWTKARIAEHLECNEKSLCPGRCPRLTAAIAAHKSPFDPGRRRLRGSKDADRNLDAWVDE
jgi:hypothetical protein